MNINKELVFLLITVFEIRENNHCAGVIFQAGNPESMLKNPSSTVIISSYFEHCDMVFLYIVYFPEFLSRNMSYEMNINEELFLGGFFCENIYNHLLTVTIQNVSQYIKLSNVLSILINNGILMESFIKSDI